MLPFYQIIVPFLSTYYLSPYFMLPKPGANPTIVSYNTSVVKIYNAMISLVRLENKNTFFCFGKCPSNTGVEVVNS
jgi:hypothetical protein